MKKENPRALPKVTIDENLRKKTNSTIFLMPALGIKKELLMKFGFVNAYIGDEGYHVVYKNALYVLLEPEFSSDLNEFIAEQYTNPNFLAEYDVGDHQIMLVYRFPTEYTNEYNNFKKGKYSRFSRTYIDRFFPMVKKEYKNGKIVTSSSVFAGIFNKEQWLKEYWEKKLEVDILPDEYWSIPDTKEIFRKHDNKNRFNREADKQDKG